ncbi:MAG TPA: hypothetical protein VGM86_34195 [Thermoanaerobaculia bacterium]|jgi:hypothetical protein
MRKNPKKLDLHRETLAALDDDRKLLGWAVGGVTDTTCVSFKTVCVSCKVTLCC